MKSVLLALLCPFLLSCIPSQASPTPMSPINIQVKVPSPAWQVQLTELYAKEDKLLVVVQATKKQGMFPMMLQMRDIDAQIPASHADLPREILLLGSQWNWTKGYRAVTDAELKKLIAGAEKVPFTVAEGVNNKKPEAADFIGLPLAEAQALADKHEIPHRVVMIDGQPQITTRDLRPDRLNFTVESGKVTQVSKG